MRKVPLHAGDGRLLGGLDLAATLRTGRPVVEPGLLVEADGGVVLLAMAERLSAGVAGRLARVLDTGEVALERDGLARRLPTRIGIVALDEGGDADEVTPPALAERLAFRLDLDGLVASQATDSDLDAKRVAEARARLDAVRSDDEDPEALCQVAGALGIGSLRAPILALRAARAAAALRGSDRLGEEDVEWAARLVLAHRARAWPGLEEPEEEPPPEPEPDEPAAETRSAPEPEPDPGQEPGADPDEALSERVLEAVRASVPEGILDGLVSAETLRAPAAASGRAGARQVSKLRGRPAGVRPGDPRSGSRLHVVATLRQAAPWQPLRRRERHGSAAPGRRIEVRRDDFRVTRFRERRETTTVFVVDASGSTALHRLAEAKGAVERLLADCYVRRDRVALIAFRGREAELLLPPTRSLVRAKRSLAALPGGGGTPLASGIESATELALAVRRRGGSPLVVFLTDGRANVARDGGSGRERAQQDASLAARHFRLSDTAALVVDTAPRPRPESARLAQELGATYLPLPLADSAALCEATRRVGEAGAPRGRALD